MTTFFVIILLIIVGAFFWLATQSGKFHVFRKRLIKASPETLFNTVSDFKTWPEWTPWLAHEPGCTIEYSDDTRTSGSWYSWDGNIIGAGKMSQHELNAPQHIEGTVEFTRPMSSKSQVYWDFKAVDDDSTEVTWGMRGEMPFFMRWMSGKMDQWVGTDYAIGLDKLAMQVGDHREPFALDFDGIVESPAQHYIYTAFEGSMTDLPNIMGEGFPRLRQAVTDHRLETTGSPLSIYHKVNLKKDYVRGEIAIPVKNPPDIAGFAVGELPAGRYSRTILSGDYQHLKKAWHAAFSHLRMCKLKFNGRQPMLERYISDTNEAEGLAIKTYLDIPLR